MPTDVAHIAFLQVLASLQGLHDWLKAHAFRGFCDALGLDAGGSGLEMVAMWNVLACLICPIDAPHFAFRSQFLQLFDSGTGKVSANATAPTYLV